MKKSRNIKSQSHIEVILSFTIFIGFLIAIFYFLSPVSNVRASYSALNNAEDKLLENLSITYDKVSLVIKDADAIPSGSCFSVDNSVNLNFSGSTIIKDKNGNIAGSSISPSKIAIEKDGSEIYSIYSSSLPGTFNNYPLLDSGCFDLDESNYSFSAPSTDKIVLFENLEALNLDYAENYAGVKSGIGIEDDFEFAAYNLTMGVIMNETLSVHKIKLSPVLSRNILVKSLDRNASSKSLILNLRVW